MANDMQRPRRLEFVMNIPSPYRIDLFNQMHECASARGIELAVHFMVACLGKPDPEDMNVYCPMGKQTFDDDETTEEAPS
jgi:hypothetical protein